MLQRQQYSLGQQKKADQQDQGANQDDQNEQPAGQQQVIVLQQPKPDQDSITQEQQIQHASADVGFQLLTKEEGAQKRGTATTEFGTYSQRISGGDFVPVRGGSSLAFAQDYEETNSTALGDVVPVPAMQSAYNQEALTKSNMVSESAVSFDVKAQHHFKRATGATSQGWVTMASVAKPSDVDVQSFVTQELPLEPGDEAQDNNPFYHPAINRNGTVTSNPDPTEDYDGSRNTQGFGQIEVDNVDDSAKDRHLSGLGDNLPTFDPSFKGQGKKLIGGTVALRDSGTFLGLQEDNQLNITPDQSLKVDTQSVRLTENTAKNKATRSGIQKYSWQHQQAQNALYRHMQNSTPATLGVQRNSDVDNNPRMMASIDEGDQSKEEFGALAGEAGRQDSFAFESSADGSKKLSMQFGPTDHPKGTIGGGSIYSKGGDDRSKRMSQYSKNLQGFGAYSQNQMQLGMTEKDRKKEQQRRETNKYKNRQALDELETDSTVCFSCFDCVKEPKNSQEINLAWQDQTYHKMDEIFRQNNMDQVPEWFNPFQNEYQKQLRRVNDNGKEFQTAFIKLVKSFRSKGHNPDSMQDLHVPKQHKGTIKRYLSDMQFQILNLLRKQISSVKLHPIALICKIFREQFGKAYEKFVKPKKNELGIVDKVGVLQEYKLRTSQLKLQFKSEVMMEDGSQTMMEEEGQDIDINDINLTNQIIGEVQGFILVMRWLVYEFYNFKYLKQEGYLQGADFEAIEDDVLFIIHKKTVHKEVYMTLLVLTRLLNNMEDKKVRHKFKKIQQHRSKLFPLEQELYISGQIDQDTHLQNIHVDSNPVFDQIISVSRRTKATPFQRAITEFKEILSSTSNSPLEKLYKLQTLNIMEYFERYKKDFSALSKGKNVVLTQDENIFIRVFVMIQAKIPDMASQIEMITAFASEYMQESPDGCEISQTYLSLISCLQYIQDLNIDEKQTPGSQAQSTEYLDINDYNNNDSASHLSPLHQNTSGSNILDQSITGTGLSNLIKDANRKQKRNESKMLRQMNTNKKRHEQSQRSINYDSDGENDYFDQNDRSLSAFSKNSFFQDQQQHQLSQKWKKGQGPLHSPNAGSSEQRRDRNMNQSMVSEDFDCQTEASFDLFAVNNRMDQSMVERQDQQPDEDDWQIVNKNQGKKSGMKSPMRSPIHSRQPIPANRIPNSKPIYKPTVNSQHLGVENSNVPPSQKMMDDLHSKFSQQPMKESFHLQGTRDKAESTTSFVSNVQEVENFFLIANRLAPWKHGGSNSGSFVKYSMVQADSKGMGPQYRDVPNANSQEIMQFQRNRASTTRQTNDWVM